MDQDRHQLALECRNLAEEILAFVAQRPDAPRIADVSDGYDDRPTAHATEFDDEFAVRFGNRLQHVIIRLTDAGYGTDALDPLSYGGTSRLGAGHAAETLHAIAEELMGRGSE